jgi:hypothetical protein
MNQGAKVFLGLLAIGGIGALVFTTGKASADTPVPKPNPFPPAPPLPAGSIIPPPGTSIPLPGGGSIPVPSIPGVNSQATPGQQLPTLPTIPQPATAPPFPGLPNLIPGLAQLPQLPTVPGPAPAPAAPPASTPELPSSAPADTLALASAMLLQERSPHWRVIPLAALKTWQKSHGRSVDGAFGTGDALAMAQEIGTLPIIRAWPKGSYPGDGKLAAYRAALLQIASSAPEPRASQLRAAAARENGQGYGTPETPIVHLITLQS